MSRSKKAKTLDGPLDGPEYRLRAMVEAIRLTIGECMTVRLPGATSVHLGIIATKEDVAVVGGVFDIRALLADIDALISDVAPPFTDEELAAFVKARNAAQSVEEEP